MNFARKINNFLFVDGGSGFNWGGWLIFILIIVGIVSNFFTGTYQDQEPRAMLTFIFIMAWAYIGIACLVFILDKRTFDASRLKFADNALHVSIGLLVCSMGFFFTGILLGIAGVYINGIGISMDDNSEGV